MVVVVLGALLATGLVLPAVPASASARLPASASVGPVRNPVVLVAGTFSPASVLDLLATRLRLEGFRVEVFELPALGVGDISASSAALGPFVAEVLRRTGATDVDLVGHSQGGLVAREYVRDFGGASSVDKVIGLGTPNHGTAVAEAGRDDDCVACGQMAVGSAYLESLNAGDDSVSDVRYWQFASRTDLVVKPYTTSFLDPADGAVVNVAIQDQCWLRPVGHVGLVVDGAVFSGVRRALAGETTIRLDCLAW
jgi:triacylglycerol esterase/lipase EstA (alpha/beta hydrolase family)